MRSNLLALAVACALPACSSLPKNHTEHPISLRIAEEVHTLLLQDPNSRSLYRIMQEAELLLKKTFPESSVEVEVQLKKQKTSEGIGYVRLQCMVDKKTHTFFLSAQNTQEDGERITAKQVVKKLIWDMRETCRNYLQDRMSLFISENDKNPEQQLQLFLEEEKEVLLKHGLNFNGTIKVSGGILFLYFDDTYNGGTFEFTFMVEELGFFEKESE